MEKSGSVISLLFSISLCHAYVLEGSPTSYAQYKKWNIGINGTIEFEFKTEQPNGLMLYTDDGGTYDFFEVKLVEGALRLRYNLGGGAQTITVGRTLNDNQWHKVTIRRNVEHTTLTVDYITRSKTSRGKEFIFGYLPNNSYVYVGGMPSWYNMKLTLLALPSVIFEPRFGGAIRNLVYADDDGVIRRQELMASKGVRVTQEDACDQHDPCQHGGICISTDRGAICDCQNVDFDGVYCEKEKAPSEATFRGNEYLSYDLSGTGGEAIVSSQDEISLYFKTRQRSGLLFYTGDGPDYLNLALREGGVALTVSLGSEPLDTYLKPSKVRFDDNQWHKVAIHRKAQEISGESSLCRLSLTVDGVYSERRTMAGAFSMLASSKVFIGGAEFPHLLPGAKTMTNFVGCLRKVEFTADTLRLNLIELGSSGNHLITVIGRLEYQCQEVDAANPVTFTTQDSYLILPPWEAARSGSITFKIKTIEPNGLLLYNSGQKITQDDFFAVEMLSGHIFLHLDMGSGEIRVQATTRRVDDGFWHEVALNRNGRSGRVTVDGSAADFITPGDSNQLDLQGPLFVGGIGNGGTLEDIKNSIQFPPQLWSVRLRYGYVGCLRDFVINDRAVDIAAFAQDQDSGSIRPSCHHLPPQCESQPCMNGGICTEGWNRFLCDCSGTNFIGPTCGKDATTLSFDGTQHLQLGLATECKTQAEDITLRFRSTRPSGLLIATSSEHVSDMLELTIDSGRLRLKVRVGDNIKSIHAGQGMNDNQWHTVKLTRRGASLRLKVDDESSQLAEMSGRSTILEARTIHVGGLFHKEEELQMTSSASNFVGYMQQLFFNGYFLFEMARMDQLSHLEVTAKFGKKEQIVHHPVMFKTKHVFIGLSQLKAYISTNLYMQFKTLEANGLMLFNAGKGQDFLAVELVNGHINYIFNLGDGPVRVRDNTRNSLNDNKWHSVTIGRPNTRQHTLMVDENIATVTSVGQNENLDLRGILFLGGVPENMYKEIPKQIQSRHGFEGCLASLEFNGEAPDPINDALVNSSLAQRGCDDPSTKCTISVCANRGACVQQWNTYTCDCDMTSFSGPTCSDESTAYEFLSTFGVITYSFPEDHRPDSRNDLLVLGFMTASDDSVIVRVNSATSNDYLELEIVDGAVYVVYNMGTKDLHIGDELLGVKFNDGQYHVIRFTRVGVNATLQIDDYPVTIEQPIGRQLSVFNSQSVVQVGGKWNSVKQTVERGFVGVIAGFVFNGQRLLDLATQNDPKLHIHGNVRLLISIPYNFHGTNVNSEEIQKMQQTPALGYPGIMDDLIFSGAGSGCSADDEDECIPIFDTGSGDDLITPVYMPPTRTPTIKPQMSKTITRNRKPCDDEDCFVGSGSGEATTDDGYFTSIGGRRGPTSVSSISGETTHQSTTENAVTLPEDITPGGNNLHSHRPVWPPSPSVPSPTHRGVFHILTESYPSPKPTVDMYKPPKVNDWEPSREWDNRQREKDQGRKMRDQIHSDAAESTALIIGIIAGAMIAIILVILIIIKLRGRSEGTYKIDEGKNFQYSATAEQSTALLNGSQSHLNGTLTTNNCRFGKKKDIKEWYV